MRIKLSKNILGNIPTEEQLADLNIMESFYVIRKLKALIDSQEHGSIEVDKTEGKQAFSKKHQIWFDADEFVFV